MAVVEHQLIKNRYSGKVSSLFSLQPVPDFGFKSWVVTALT
jgi:hypothetical protein